MCPSFDATHSKMETKREIDSSLPGNFCKPSRAKYWSSFVQASPASSCNKGAATSKNTKPSSWHTKSIFSADGDMTSLTKLAASEPQLVKLQLSELIQIDRGPLCQTHHLEDFSALRMQEREKSQPSNLPLAVSDAHWWLPWALKSTREVQQGWNRNSEHRPRAAVAMAAAASGTINAERARPTTALHRSCALKALKQSPFFKSPFWSIKATSSALAFRSLIWLGEAVLLVAASRASAAANSCPSSSSVGSGGLQSQRRCCSTAKAFNGHICSQCLREGWLFISWLCRPFGLCAKLKIKETWIMFTVFLSNVEHCRTLTRSFKRLTSLACALERLWLSGSLLLSCCW